MQKLFKRKRFRAYIEKVMNHTAPCNAARMCTAILSSHAFPPPFAVLQLRAPQPAILSTSPSTVRSTFLWYRCYIDPLNVIVFNTIYSMPSWRLYQIFRLSRCLRMSSRLESSAEMSIPHHFLEREKVRHIFHRSIVVDELQHAANMLVYPE